MPEEKSIDLDIIELLRREPFWGHVIISMRRVEDIKIEAATGVSVKGGNLTLLYNPDAYFSETLPERLATLKHEAMHVTDRHFARRDDIEKGDSLFSVLSGEAARAVKDMHQSCLYEVFNYAADAAINQYIKDIPEKCVFPHSFGAPPGLSTEEYFALLLKQAAKIPSSGSGKGESSSGKEGEDSQCEGGGNGNGKKPGGKGGCGKKSKDGGGCPVCGSGAKALPGKLLDDHSGWAASQEDVQAAAAAAVTIVKECHSRGLIPSDMESLFDDILKPKINVKSVISSFAASCKSESVRRSWMRVNRRLPGVLKGKIREDKLSLIFAIDTSGSVNDEMLKLFNGILVEFYKEGVEIYVIECDARVYNDYKFSGKISPVKRRGGTAFQPVFDFIKEKRLHPDGIIYLTDGYGDDPEPFRAVPLLWIVTPDGKKPASWGRTLFMPK